MKNSLLDQLKDRSTSLKREIYAVYYASRDPRVPWYAKALLALLLAYALSPIDLVPDFIPVLGYVDDLIIIPLGITVALKLIPAQVMEDARSHAEDMLQHGKGISWFGAVLIIGIWLIVLAAVIWFIANAVSGKRGPLPQG